MGSSITATALTTHAARSKMLTIAGVDVLIEPVGAAGRRYGAPLDSISMTERGPGGVSTMRLDIEDPDGELTLRRGQEVLFQDLTNDTTIFRGFLATVRTRAADALARAYSVTAVGVEIILDWSKVETMTLNYGPGPSPDNFPYPADVIQRLAANCINGHAAPLRAFMVPGGTFSGDQTGPIQEHMGNVGTQALTGSLVIPAGTSLREAMRMVMQIATGHPGYWDFQTVDFTLGLRAYMLLTDEAPNPGPGDYTILDIRDNAAGAIAAANLEDVSDVGSAPTAVYVKGTGVTLLVTDGTNEAGETAYLNEPQITDAVAAALAGAQYLRQWKTSSRGEFDLENIADATGKNVHAGGLIDLLDSVVGVQKRPVIGSIERTFHSASQDWHVTYGGLPASLATLVRRVTRATPN